MLIVSTSEHRKASTRTTPDGEVQVRVGAWVRAELVEKFRELARDQQVDMSDVIRSSIRVFVVEESERKMMGKKSAGERALARRVFRALIGSMGAKEVLQEVLKLMPSKEVKKVVTTYMEFQGEV